MGIAMSCSSSIAAYIIRQRDRVKILNSAVNIGLL